MSATNPLISLKIALIDVANKNEARQQSCWSCFSSKYVVVKTTDGSFESTKACWFFYSNGAKLATHEDLSTILDRPLYTQLQSTEKEQVASGLTFMKCGDIAARFLGFQYDTVTVTDNKGWKEIKEQQPPKKKKSKSSKAGQSLPPAITTDPNFDVASHLAKSSTISERTSKKTKQPTISQVAPQPQPQAVHTYQRLEGAPDDILGLLETEGRSKEQPVLKRESSPTTTNSTHSNESRETSPQVVRKVEGQSAYRGKLEEQFGVHFLDDVQFSTKKSTVKLSNLSVADREAIVTYIQRSYLVDPNDPRKGYKGGNSCPPTVYLQDENILVMNSGLSDGAVKRELTLTYDTMVRILELKKVKSCAHLYNSSLFQRMKAANA